MRTQTIDRILKLAPSPAYVLDLGKLRENLAVLDDVQRPERRQDPAGPQGRSPCGASSPSSGRRFAACAPARRGRRAWAARSSAGRSTPSRPALRESDVASFLETSNHLVFNSFDQLERFRPLWEPASRAGRLSVGLRVNPEHSEGHTPLYDPCAPGSRLGIRRAELRGQVPRGRGGPPLPHPVRAALRAPGQDCGGLRGEVRGLPGGDEVGEPRRRAPHHPGRLRRRRPGRPGPPVPGALRRGGLPGARGGGGAGRRGAGHRGPRPRLEHRGHRGPGRLGRLPHARRPRDALPPAAATPASTPGRNPTPTAWPGRRAWRAT